MPSGTPPLGTAAGLSSFEVITRCQLHQPMPDPDPSAQRTTILFDVPTTQTVTLKIYDASGRLIKNLVNEQKPRGRHVLTWENSDESGRQVPSGAYFARMTAGRFTANRQFGVR